MKPGSLLKIIHRMDPVYREMSWKLVIYLEHENLEIRGETIKVIDPDGRINHYPLDSFHFSEVLQ